MIEVAPQGSVPSYVDLTAPIPLGAHRRTVIVVIASTLSFIGLLTTLLFQQLSKTDNYLRQRGRYLVTLQGLFSSLSLTLLLFYQAYKYRFPCIILYYGSYFGLLPFVMLLTGRGWRLISRVDRNHAIYLSRFAEPSDIAAVESSSIPTLKDRATVPPRNRSNPSLINLSSLQQQQRRGSISVVQSESKSKGAARTGGETGEVGVFELVQRSAREIAQSKKWYNRYRTVTDRQMLAVAVIFIVVSTIIAVIAQLNTPGVSLDPVIYVCHSGAEYALPYGSIVVFLFGLSPLMIYQLKGIHDGFGIRKELRFISIFSAPCVALYFLVPPFAPDFTIKYVDRTTYMVLILIVGHFLSIVMPLAHHFRTTPNNCPITSGRAFRRKPRRVSKAATTSDSFMSTTEPSNGKDKSEDVGQAQATSGLSWNLTPTRTREQDDFFHGSQLQSPPVPARAVSKQVISGREQLNTTTVTIQEDNDNPHLHHTISSQYQQRHGRKLSAGNMNMSLKNLLKTSKLSQFHIIGFNQQQQQQQHQDLAELDGQKADWNAFLSVLDDRELFERLSAFTVGEFCAENTRFLYEVSRLEKRAIQYEHLRELTATPLVAQDRQQQLQQEPSWSASLHRLYKSSATSSDPMSTRLSKTASTLTTHSILAPLPTHFSSPNEDKNENGMEVQGDSHHVKKIVSLSSVNSTAPLLRPRRSSSSYFDESEPSSPMAGGGGFPCLNPQQKQHQSAFMRHGSGSNTALPDLDESIALRKLNLEQIHPHSPSSSFNSPTSETTLVSPTRGMSSTAHHNLVDLTTQRAAAASASLQLTPLPMPPTLLIQFEYVYKTFIQHGGRLELNLSYDTSLEIQRRAKKGDWQSGLFDRAIDEIQDLLFRDVWPKFVSSPHGLYAALQQQQQQQQHHQQSIKNTSSAFGHANSPTGTAAATAAQSSGTSTEGAHSHPQIGLGPASRTSMYVTFEQQSSTTPKSSLSKATSQRVTPTDQSSHTARTGSIGSSSSKTRQGSTSSVGKNVAPGAAAVAPSAVGRSRSHSSPKNVDGFYQDEEPTKSGFRTWLTGGSGGRRGLAGRGHYYGGRGRGNGVGGGGGGGQEESLGIIEASRKSVADRRRSDISGLI
ncbi:hypothetical protein BGZ83_000592 [Gryganskiella cystojenkinii]|nr:hypothetical protein BGZ83_000592 [Gryganskiella cystojenkinii]